MIVQPTASDIAAMLCRRWRVGAATAFLLFAAGIAYLLIATPYYRSEASVVVRFDTKSMPDTNLARDSEPTVTAQNDRHETVLSHADILTSRDMAQAVIGSVGLARAYPKIVAKPPARGTPMDEAVRVFSRNLNVEPEQQGDVINIGFSHPDPVLAQRMVEELIEFYMRREAELFSGADYAFQKQLVDAAGQRLTDAQAALKAFRARTGIASFDDQIAALIKQRGDVSAALQAAQVALTQAEQHRDSLHALLQTVSQTVSNSANGEKYRSLDDAQAKLADLRGKETQMLTSYRPDSPMLTQLRASITAAESDVRGRSGDTGRREASAPNVVYQTIQTDLLRATADSKAGQDAVAQLRGQLTATEQELAAIAARQGELADRTRAVDIADSAYRALALHLEDARVAESRLRDAISHGAILAAPTLPYKVAKPRYLILTAAFLLASLMAGAIASLIAELGDNRFTSQDQVAHALGLPVLASFPERA